MKINIEKMLYIIIGILIFSLLFQTCSNSSQNRKIKQLTEQIRVSDSIQKSELSKLEQNLNDKIPRYIYFGIRTFDNYPGADEARAREEWNMWDTKK